LGWTGSAFSWVNSPSATSATNLAGGGAYTVVYQSAAGTTAYLANGTTGQVLKATTDGAPTWGDTGDVTLTGTQTLTNKTLTSPVITQNVQVISTNTTAVRSRTYVMTASLTLTLPASPAPGDWVKTQNSSGTQTCVIARNGQNIMSLAENLTINAAHVPVNLIYADSTRGWVFTN
jgi:hypothetical protein